MDVPVGVGSRPTKKGLVRVRARARRWAVPALTLVVELSFSGPARADWEYARWGMSVSEVIAASRGRAMIAQGAGRSRRASSARTSKPPPI
jgi:hypothetical protein